MAQYVTTENEMLLNLSKLVPVLLLTFSFWGGVVGLGQAASASPKAKKETETRFFRARVGDRVVSPESVPVGDRKTWRKERERHAIAKPYRKKPPARHMSPGRWKQVQKNPPPLEPVQSKPDLSYYGVLEQPQRYNPSRDRGNGAVPNLLEGELGYDHFQELDKNLDGVIDPLERAFSRLDIDRDLANRQRE